MSRFRVVLVATLVGVVLTASSCTPTPPSAEPHVVDVATGADHSCALLSNGAIRCWGEGDRLGVTPTTDSATPITVDGINGFTKAIDVDAGLHHTCAVMSSNAVECWGANDKGQLGDGNFTDQPTKVPALTGSNTDACTNPAAGVCNAASQVSAGGDHTCAVLLNQTIACWGDNAHGELGVGSIGGVADVPVTVEGLPGPALSVSAGQYDTCAIIAAHGAWCWGEGGSGELGNGGTTSSGSPVLVSFSDVGPQPVSVSVGGNFTECATLSDHTVWCWGLNGNGQVGDGTTTERDVPTRTSGVSATAVAAGYGFACSADETVILGLECWGYNLEGQLGNPGLGVLQSPTPQAMLLFGNMADIDADARHTCATNQRSVWCWGFNDHFDLGTTTGGSRPDPIKVPGF
jgi:alpha-tubulin suppressor-like RCC1 family protein